MVIILHEEWRVFSWFEEQDRGFPSSSFHFPSGSQGRYLRGPLDLITIYERDSTDLRTSGDPRVIRKANGCCRRRLFSRSIHNAATFSFEHGSLSLASPSIKKKKNEERKKKRINLHISIKVDCPIITETSFKIKRKTHRNLKHFNLVQRKKYQKEIKLIRCREFKTRI